MLLGVIPVDIERSSSRLVVLGEALLLSCHHQSKGYNRNYLVSFDTLKIWLWRMQRRRRKERIALQVCYAHRSGLFVAVVPGFQQYSISHNYRHHYCFNSCEI